MLRKCPECSVVFLVSEFAHLCNQCGEYLRQRIEKLHEVDDAIEWVVLLSMVHNPEQPRLRHRWRVV